MLHNYKWYCSLLNETCVTTPMILAIKKLYAHFQGLLSAVQPFSHPLTQLPLIIGLPCETYNRVSPGKLFLSPLCKQRTLKYRAQGISDLHKHRPIRVPIYTRHVKFSKKKMRDSARRLAFTMQFSRPRGALTTST